MNSVPQSALFRRSLLAAALALGVGCVPLVGNGVEAVETREVGPFKRLAVESGISATYSPGVQALEVGADQNLLPYLETVVEGETLIVRMRRTLLVSPGSSLHATVSSPEMLELSASGGASIDAALPPSKEAAVLVSGSGGSHVVARNVDARSLELHASGGSVLTAEGASPSLQLHASGGSQVTTDAIAAQDVVLHGSGGSQLRVRATASVEGSLSGGSRATVFGSPARRAVDDSAGSSATYP